MEIGGFFKKLTGKDASDFNSLTEIDKAVAEAVGHDVKVEFYQSSLVSPRGSVFSIANTPECINDQIDKSFF